MELKQIFSRVRTVLQEIGNGPEVQLQRMGNASAVEVKSLFSLFNGFFHVVLFGGMETGLRLIFSIF